MMLAVAKPVGVTSNAVLYALRSRLRALARVPSLKVGHAGTLDPLASGVLVLGSGSFTKVLHQPENPLKRKQYLVTGQLGLFSPSFDMDSVPGAALLAARQGFASELPPETPETAALIQRYVLSAHATGGRSKQLLVNRAADQIAVHPWKATLANQEWPQLISSYLTQLLASPDRLVSQRPPAFSALKTRGMRSYAAVREGAEVYDLPARLVSLYGVELRAFDEETGSFTLWIDCGAGFYVRSLVRDIGEQALGTAATVTMLERTAQGPFTVGDALEWHVGENVSVDILQAALTRHTALWQHS